MEYQKPVLGQRSSSFNPEAAAFSPTPAPFATPNGKEATAPIITTPPAAPCEVFEPSMALEHDSTCRSADNMRPFYLGEADTPRAPVSLEGLVPLDITLDALQSMLQEHHVALNQGKAYPPLQNTGLSGLSSATVNRPMAHPPSLVFPSQRPEPNFSAVDVDELSTTLGLPGMKKSTTTGESPTRSQKFVSPQGHPDVHGKLIVRALDKPLTADALAQYLNRGSISSDDTIMASRDFQEAVMGFGTPNRKEGQAMKVVRPPPGFDGESARRILAEEHTSVAPATMEPKYIPTAPAAFQYSRRNSPFQPVNHIQHHARRASTKRRSRALTRIKRTDQGPEPSAADIYPDDANWEPSHRPFRGKQTVHYQPSFVPQWSPQRELHVNDASSWPTPAEVYTDNEHIPHKPPTPTLPSNIFENYVPPRAVDLNAADGEVLAMIDQLPDTYMNTGLNFSAHNLSCDKRPLTPGQEDGNRYGMKYLGLALGDVWNPAVVEEGRPFRVRPRDHTGWGGWEWAVKKGWADE